MNICMRACIKACSHFFSFLLIYIQSSVFAIFQCLTLSMCIFVQIYIYRNGFSLFVYICYRIHLVKSFYQTFISVYLCLFLCVCLRIYICVSNWKYFVWGSLVVYVCMNVFFIYVYLFLFLYLFMSMCMLFFVVQCKEKCKTWF